MLHWSRDKHKPEDSPIPITTNRNSSTTYRISTFRTSGYSNEKSKTPLSRSEKEKAPLDASEYINSRRKMKKVVLEHYRLGMLFLQEKLV
jgi:hypothetical protein